MNRRQTGPIPEAIAQLQRQFDQFRSTQPRRTKLPEPLWQAAVDLAREHGIYAVAHPLRLDYVGLKKRLSGVSHSRARGRRRSFPLDVHSMSARAFQIDCALVLRDGLWCGQLHEFWFGCSGLGEHPKPAIDNHLKTGQR